MAWVPEFLSSLSHLSSTKKQHSKLFLCVHTGVLSGVWASQRRPAEDIRGYWMPWGWGYKMVVATIRLLGIRPWDSGRVVSDPTMKLSLQSEQQHIKNVPEAQTPLVWVIQDYITWVTLTSVSLRLYCGAKIPSIPPS